MATITDPVVRAHKREVIDKAVIRFCGDSGDGMQISGSQFTNTVALYGNDLATFPDYPAEIRAPAGTLPGVSGFQIQFSSSDVYTPGDSVDVLVAMNPAALKMNVKDLKANGILIVNSDSFADADLHKAHIDHQSAGGSFARRLSRVSRAARAPDARRAAGPGPRRQEHEPLQELLRAGHVLLALQPPDGSHLQLARRQIQDQAAAGRSQQARHEGRLQLLRGHRSLPGQLRNSAGQAHSRHLSQSQRQSGPGHGLRGGVAARPACRCSSAPIRSRPLPTFCTSFPATRTSA